MAKKSKKKRIILGVILSVVALLLVYVLCAWLPYVGEKDVSEEFKRSFSAEKFYSNGQSGERVMLLDDGADAYFYRLNIIEQAQDEIIFTTYATYKGESTSNYFGALIKAADRGVKVKILLDGKFGYSGGSGGIDRVMESHENIEVYYFNPFNFFKPQALNVSMHDKFLIIDNRYLILGGRNVGDQYYDPAKYGGKYSHDREVLVYNPDNAAAEGRAVTQVREYFKSLTKSKSAKLKRAKANKKSTEKKAKLLSDYAKYFESNIRGKTPDYAAITLPVNKITLITNPVDGYKKEPHIFYTVMRLAKSCEKAFIQTPYTVLTKSHRRELESLCAQTKVTYLTNSFGSTPNPPAFSNYVINRKKYVAMDMDIYEYQGVNASIHAKTMLFGDRLTAVGSFNLDERSIHIDTESMLVIDGAEFTAKAYECLNGYIAQSLKVEKNGGYESGSVQPLKVGGGKKALYYTLGFLLQPFLNLL